MDLIDSILKNEVSKAMTDVFDTFARIEPVKFFKMPNSEVVAYDPNFNGGFQQIENLANYNSQVVSQSFICRVIYMAKQDEVFLSDSSAPISGKTHYNKIKLQCKENAFEYLKDTERFIFFDEKYIPEETWSRIGILGTFQHYQIVLRRII